MYIFCEDCQWEFSCDHHGAVMDAAAYHEDTHEFHSVVI